MEAKGRPKSRTVTLVVQPTPGGAIVWYADDQTWLAHDAAELGQAVRYIVDDPAVPEVDMSPGDLARWVGRVLDQYAPPAEPDPAANAVQVIVRSLDAEHAIVFPPSGPSITCRGAEALGRAVLDVATDEAQPKVRAAAPRTAWAEMGDRVAALFGGGE